VHAKSRKLSVGDMAKGGKTKKKKTNGRMTAERKKNFKDGWELGEGFKGGKKSPPLKNFRQGGGGGT